MFDLDAEQWAKLAAWKKTRPARNEGCSGGRYVYQFCPTSLGIVVKVIDDCTKEEIDLTDYESW